MKVEVEIPKGKYCGDCMLGVREQPEMNLVGYCNYLSSWLLERYAEDTNPKAKLGEVRFIVHSVKHPDCPSLKEKE